MSSSKLDQSLEEIAGSRRGGNARRGRRAGPKPAAPRASGGITKNTATKPTKASVARNAPRTAPKPTTSAPQASGEGKIIVSNLPFDVTEQMTKEYFSKNVGPIKKVLMSYDKNGKSLGIATIIFRQAQHATEAAKTYNGLTADQRPMKIEVVVGANAAPAQAKPKGLGERISLPKKDAAKPKPKPATVAPKAAAANGATPAAGRGGRKGKGRAGRPKPKSVEELDAEMSEYFVPGTTDAPATNTNGAAPTAAPALDASMDDGVL